MSVCLAVSFGVIQHQSELFVLDGNSGVFRLGGLTRFAATQVVNQMPVVWMNVPELTLSPRELP